MTPLAIPAHVLDWIYAHAIAAFPAECCGYLTGPAGGDAVDQLAADRAVATDRELAVVVEQRLRDVGRLGERVDAGIHREQRDLVTGGAGGMGERGGVRQIGARREHDAELHGRHRATST